MTASETGSSFHPSYFLPPLPLVEQEREACAVLKPRNLLPLIAMDAERRDQICAPTEAPYDLRLESVTNEIF